jgi:maltose-binding protein MalE
VESASICCYLCVFNHALSHLTVILTAGISPASPNSDLAKEFIENYLHTDDGLRYMKQYGPIGAPALKSNV